ncbi:uncharacterized protein LOC120453484 [Drosophila santomea]|uniref:uncharacterized protein LOC120453484 n=1 Tax=Drosophila santomea TaxID=129105 RepID=UPI001953C1F8|nr:uncharacterized protein LOC120453484 [Drosophila santomea]
MCCAKFVMQIFNCVPLFAYHLRIFVLAWLRKLSDIKRPPKTCAIHSQLFQSRTMKLTTYLLALVLFAGFFLLQPSSAQTNSTTSTNTTTTEATTSTTSTTAKTVNRKHFTMHNVKYKVVRRIRVNKKNSG